MHPDTFRYVRFVDRRLFNLIKIMFSSSTISIYKTIKSLFCCTVFLKVLHTFLQTACCVYINIARKVEIYTHTEHIITLLNANNRLLYIHMAVYFLVSYAEYLCLSDESNGSREAPVLRRITLLNSTLIVKFNYIEN